MFTSARPTILLVSMELGERLPEVDVYRTDDYVILTKGPNSLWCSRKNGQMIPRSSVDMASLGSPVSLGKVWGFIGKMHFFTDGDWKLILITHATSVGAFPAHGEEVFCVDQVGIVALSTDTNPEVIGMEALGSDAAEHAPPRAPSPTLSRRLRKNLTSGAGDKGKDLKDKEKVERRLTEALLWMFNDSHSFYFCPGADLTQSLQRQANNTSNTTLNANLKWQEVDERFFWNKQMLSDLIEGSSVSELSDPWVLPVIQGYVEVRQVPVVNSETIEALQRRTTGELQRKNSGADLRSRVLQCSDDFGFEMIEMDAGDQANYAEADDTGVVEEETGSGSGYESDNESNGSRDTDDDLYREVPNQQTAILNENAVDSCNQPTVDAENVYLNVPQRRGSNASTDPSSAVEDLCSKIPTVDEDSRSPFLSDASPDGKQPQEYSEVPTVTMAIISRRSRHRAGTRYRRRGVDVRGNVANYVETEVVIQAGTHLVSYVIARGSVPVYWTQPGYKYRPLPVIEKGVEETKEAFKTHFDQQLDLYSEIGIVNLVRQTGREKALADAYEDHVLQMDNPLITYIAFDFHQHYKTNQVYGVKQLLEGASTLIKKFKFCWLDTEQVGSILCQQDGVFRVNCMDCLDRTNVIQSILSREVLQSALQKLGVIPFEEKLEGITLQAYQEIWANNGDCISRQYTGTAAMKGDITRYGERKLSGLMKDGYNSAHRYYLNIFRDTYKQVLIDLMQGASPTDAFASLPNSVRGVDDDGSFLASSDNNDPVWSLEREEAIADMIQHCRQELFPDKSLHVQGWALIEPEGYSFVDNSRKEEECVILQCRERSHLCVASYRSDLEQVCCFIRIPMEKIEKIVVGPIGMLLRSSKRLHMRIYYSLINDSKCYFTLRTVNFVSMEEDRAILMSIANALSYLQSTIHVQEQKLTKRRSPPHEGVVYLMLPNDWEEVDERIQDDNPTNQSSFETPILSSSDVSETQGVQAHVQSEIDEDEEDVSLSAPSSPKVNRKTPLAREQSTKRSKSFDDIISSVNNEQPKSPKLNPVIRNPVSQSFVFNLLDDSDLDFDVDPNEITTNQSVEPIDSTVTSIIPQVQKEIDLLQTESKFSRLKDKFLNLKSGAMKRLEASSVKTTDTDDSDGSSQIRQKFLAVGQRFRSTSPSLLRKTSRGRSPQRELSDDEIKKQEARERSKSKIIHI